MKLHHMYLRERTHPIGCVCVAISDSGVLRVGTSVCSSDDRWNTNFGRYLAEERARESTGRVISRPPDLCDVIEPHLLSALRNRKGSYWNEDSDRLRFSKHIKTLMQEKGLLGKESMEQAYLRSLEARVRRLEEQIMPWICPHKG